MFKFVLSYSIFYKLVLPYNQFSLSSKKIDLKSNLKKLFI